MKRPMIFIKGLNQPEIENLKALSEYSSLKSFSKFTQVYTRSNGSLGIAYDSIIDKKEETQCTTYEEFLTKWEQYKLWLILQTQ